MSKIDQLIREVERASEGYADILISREEWKALKAKYATAKPARIPAKRAKPRKNRETLVEHQEVMHDLFLRAKGMCEGAHIRRDGQIVVEHAPHCPGLVSWLHGDPSHIKSRGSGGEWSLDNLLWQSRQCHRWQHQGGKVVPKKPTVEFQRVR